MIERRSGHDRRGLAVLATRRFVAALFLTACVLIIVLTWKSEKDSCIRNSGVRSGFNATVGIQSMFLQAARARNERTLTDPKISPIAKNAARDAIRDYDVLLKAQRPVRELDCGGLFPENS